MTVVELDCCVQFIVLCCICSNTTKILVTKVSSTITVVIQIPSYHVTQMFRQHCAYGQCFVVIGHTSDNLLLDVWFLQCNQNLLLSDRST